MDYAQLAGFPAFIETMTVVAVLLFLTPLLFPLPRAMLSANIFMAVGELIDIAFVKHASLASRPHGIASAVSFGAALAFAPSLDMGVLVGVVLFLGLDLYRIMKPRVAPLGRHLVRRNARQWRYLGVHGTEEAGARPDAQY
ncbi:MAG: hypothetical protein LH479_04200 [Polaromonas sp.]|nr:hypothetical protein [Polaromonas sp.]